jgi:hypothetical protein
METTSTSPLAGRTRANDRSGHWFPGFLVAGAVQLVLLAGGSSGFLGGNASTFSLWLGLGVGLIAVGLAAVPEMTQEGLEATD